MVILYDNEFSTCATKVRLAFAEKEQSWCRKRVDLAAMEQKAATYLQINPSGLVPALEVHDGPALVESHVILEFIEAAYAGTPLKPSTPIRTARMQLWLKTIDETHAAASALVAAEVFIPLWRGLDEEELNQRLGRFANQAAAEYMRQAIARGIDEKRQASCRSALRQLFLRADAALAQQRWLLGDREADFSLADIALAPYADSPLRAINDQWREDCPHIGRWLRAIRSRPSYLNAVTSYPYAQDVQRAIDAAPSGSGRVPT